MARPSSSRRRWACLPAAVRSVDPTLAYEVGTGAPSERDCCLQDDYRRALFSVTTPGQIAAPVRTPWGWDMVLFVDYRIPAPMTEAELGAKLPLAVLQLGGHVKQGNALSLRYFVRGVSFATAASLYRGDLKQGCEGATHFVQNYVVGAYELGESASSSAGASAGIGPVGAGGETTKTASSLFRGGAMSECKAGGSGCQAPVRLRLLGILDQRPEFVDAEAHAAELTKPEPGKKRPPLTNKEVVRSISALKPAIAACADETPGAGTLSVKLEFSIASDGVVKVVNLTGAESNLAVDGCLREVAWSARFPSAADEDGLRIVKYPFTVTWQPP